MTTISHTSQPLYAVHIVCAGKRIGETAPTSDQEAVRNQHYKLTGAYPDSRLMVSLAHESWQEADDATLKRITFQQTYTVLGEILAAGLPLMSWSLKEWAPGKLEGSLNGESEADARATLADYMQLFNADEFAVQESAHGLNLGFHATWHGVQIEVGVYVPIRKLANKASEQPAEVKV